MKKRIFIILGVLIALVLIVAIVINSRFSAYKDYMKTVDIGYINLESIDDGAYTGTSNAGGIVVVEVLVTIKDHAIETIDLTKHENGRGKPAEVIIDDVIASQGLQVDTITGATNSSLIILEAIQNALE